MFVVEIVPGLVDDEVEVVLGVEDGVTSVDQILYVQIVWTFGPPEAPAFDLHLCVQRNHWVPLHRAIVPGASDSAFCLYEVGQLIDEVPHGILGTSVGIA